MLGTYRLDVTLTLLGPILTRGGGMVEPGIDAPVARDGRGRPMLPFSLIKGKVRDAFRELRPKDSKVVEWLGEFSEFDPERGRLRFSDFVTDKPGQTPDGVIERIEIDEETGGASGRMLAMIEAPFGYGQPVPFVGRVEFVADVDEALEIKAALDEALRWVPAYGAMRTVGFGRTQKVETTWAPSPLPVPRPPEGSTADASSSLFLRLRFDRPLCLVGRKHSGNHFDSLTTVSGSVLKGALARRILELDGSSDRYITAGQAPTRWPNLREHFAKVRFAEARPMEAGEAHRPVQPPLSIVTAGGKCYDVALEAGPVLIGGMAPAFDTDWKGDDPGMVRKDFGWPDLTTERRTRTSIEEDTGRAKDEALFSYGLVLPEVRKLDEEPRSTEKPNEEFRPVVWESSIGLEGIKEGRAGVIEEIVDLLARGLPGIGKTRATAEVEWLKEATPDKVAQVAGDHPQHVVTLQTDFLMTNPDLLREGRPEDLEAAYRDYWEEASGGALGLVRFFARQTLHGGFLARRSRLGKYKPFLVTERGSTFVLEPVDRVKARDLLAGWRQTGLPVPGWIEGFYRREGGGDAPAWQTCPFLPHVGFGEVAIDLECHTSKRPPGGEA